MGKTTFFSGITPQSRAGQSLRELACNETMTGNRSGFTAGTNNKSWTISLLPGKGVVLMVMLMFVVLITNALNRYSAASGNWNSTSTWSTSSGGGGGASVPVAGDVVYIEGGDNVTVNVANAACTAIQIGSPTSGNGAGTLTFNALSQLTVAGTVSLGNSGSTSRFGTITMTLGGTLICGAITSNSTTDIFTEGTGTIVLSLPNTLASTNNSGQLSAFNHLTINAGTTTLARNTTVAGVLTVKAGATLAKSTFTLGSPSSIILDCGAPTGSSITGSAALTLGGNITVNSIGTGTNGALVSSPVTLGGNRTFTVADDGSSASDLTFSGVISGGQHLVKSGNGTLSCGTANVSVGNFTINAGTFVSTSTILNVTGIFTNNATFTHSSGLVNLNGTSAQIIGGTSITTFINLTLNNSSHASLSNNIIVNGVLTLTAGRLTLGTYNLLLGSANVAGTPSVNNMIVATGTGELRRLFTGNGSYTFPVGDATGAAEYSPITLDFASGTYASAYAGVRLTNAKHPNNASATNFLSRYWTISSPGISSFSCTVTGTFPAADVNGTVGNMITGKWNGSWAKYGTVTSNTITAAGVTSFSDFTGITGAAPTVSITPNPSLSVCQNASLTLTANPVGDATFTYAWSTGATTAAISPSTAASGSPSYSVTVTDGNGFTASNSASVTVNELPSCSITGSDHLCPGDGSSYSATSGMSTYSWSISGNGTTEGATNAVNLLVNAGNICDDNFTLTSTVTDANGCVSSCEQVVNLSPASTVSMICPTPLTSPICQEQSAIDLQFANWLATFSHSGGCNSAVTVLPATPSAPAACGGSKTVMWIVSSSCEADQSCQSTFTVTNPDAIVFECPVDATESTGQTQTAIDGAFASWLNTFISPTGGCNPTAATTPALPAAPPATGGSVTVTWTVSSDCEAPSTCSARFTVGSDVPVILTCAGDITEPSCQTQTEINSAFDDWLNSTTYSGGCNANMSDDNMGAPDACGGSTTVTWTVTNDCGADETCSATFTVENFPTASFSSAGSIAYSSCDFNDQAEVETTFNNWLNDYSIVSGCFPSVDYGTPTAPVLCSGGTTSVTYTVTDQCGSDIVETVNFKIEAPEAVQIFKPADYSANACTFANQTEIENAFNTWLIGFTVSGGCFASGDFGTVYAPDYCIGGTTIVTYTVTDICSNGTSSASFTIVAPTALDVHIPNIYNEDACIFADQSEVEAAFAAWLTGFYANGGCSPVGDYGAPAAPILCTGGTTNVEYIVTSTCQNASEIAHFTVNAPLPLSISKPANFNQDACNFADQTAVESAFASWLDEFIVNGGCSPAGDMGSPVAPTLCTGGTTTVTFNVSDLCDNGSETASFTINAPSALSITKPANFSATACDYADQDAVDAAFATWLLDFTATGGCSPQGSYGTPTAPVLCTGGTTTVTYSVTDLCATGSSSATFSINAPAALSITKPANFSATACDYADQDAVDAAFATWLLDFTATGGCSPQGSYGTPTAPVLCTGGTTTVTYSVTDLCATGSSSATFSINAPAALSITKPANFSATACDFADQDAVDAAFASWLVDFTVTGGCSPLGNYGTPLAPVLCTGGTTTVTYTVTDLCASGSSSATFTINAPAALSITKAADFSASTCDFADQDAVEAAFSTWLLDFSVTGGCSPSGITGRQTAPVLCTGGTTTITYTVTDLCATGSSSATFTINAPSALSITNATDFSGSACDFADQDAADLAFATWLLDFTFSGGCTPSGSYGTPIAPVLCTGGTTTVTYTVTDLCETGTSSASFTIDAPAALTVNKPTSISHSTCEFADQAAIDLAFDSWLTAFTVIGGCSPSESYGTVTAPIFCAGGTTTVTYEVSDLCVTTSEVASFTIDAAPSLTLNCAGDYDAASCSSQTTINSMFANWLLSTTVTGGCNTIVSTSPAVPEAPLACGGSITVTWTVSSDCAADQSCSASFSVTPATEVTFTCAENITEAAGQTQETINTKFEDWMATATYSGGCGVVVTTDPTVAVAPDACGGSVTVYWTVSSTCEADITCSATFSVYTAISMDCNYPDQCRGNQPFNLTGGLPSGGTYSGTAVIGGMFYPELGNPGPNAVTYTVDLGNGCMGYAYCDINILNTVKSVVYVGTNPTDDYPNLSGAAGLFADINAKGICSTIVVYITTNITEPGIIALNQRLEYGPGGYFVIIKPNSPSEKLIQGNFPLGIIRFNGADRLVINGQFNTNNVEHFLRFRNNSTVGPVFNFTNGATINYISYCTIEGANTNANSGLIVFGTSTSVGNSYNNIEYCVIKNGIGIPANAIYSSGSAAAPNHTNYMLGNNIKTFNQNGVYVTGTGNGGSWYINGNMFSWENPGSPATLAQCAINLIPGSASHDNFVVDNVIGGSEPGNLGMWTNSGAITFKGISVSSGTTGILNNTIHNITLSNPGGTTFMGIELLAGASFMGAPSAPNIIGDPTNDNSIILGGLCNFFGIRSVSTNPGITITSNVIANVTSTVAIGYPNMYGIYVRTGTISKNLVYKLGTSNTGTLPAIFGIMNLGIIGPNTDFYDNMVSLSGGMAINPKIFGIQDNAYAAAGPLPSARYAHNTVEVSGAATNFSKTFAYQRNYNGNVEVKNNIFYNSRPTSPVGHYAISSANTLNWTSDYNSLYATSSNLGFWGATNSPTLAAWKLITSQDANSISVAPVFVSSPSDLHIDPLETSNAAFNNVCPAVPYAYWDIDNTTRTGLVDMGADEFDAVSRNAPEAAGFEASLDFYPNPFESGARIGVSLAQDSKISLVVYNILGDKVADITEENLISGKYEYSFAADELPAGVYLVRMYVVSGDHNNVYVKRIVKNK